MAPGRTVHRPGDRPQRRLDTASGHPPPPGQGRRRDRRLGQHRIRRHRRLRGHADHLDRHEHRQRLRDHPGDRRSRRLPTAPRSGGEVGALELAGRARHIEQPAGAPDARRTATGRHRHPWRWNTGTPSKRGRWIVVIGVLLALAAGGAAFYLINQAQQQAGQGTLQKADVVVAVRPIPARKPIEADDSRSARSRSTRRTRTRSSSRRPKTSSAGSWR